MFLNKYKTLINFKPIIYAHERDIKRIFQIRKLNIASAFPALWNKMNISAANISFTYEAIGDTFCRFGKCLQCQDDMRSQSKKIIF